MLEKLFNPDVVAVIGASQSPEKVGYAILSNLIEGGFKGEIVPINPKGGTILEQKTYVTLSDYGKKIDLAVIAVPARFVEKSIDDCLTAGANSIILITAGFKEVDEEGAALEEKIATTCRDKGVRLLGPNCLGLINTKNKMNASFAKQTPKQGSIAVVSQSGALCTAILDWADGRQLGLSKLVSIGNKADLNEVDFIKELAHDEETKVIACYLESISQGEAFLQAAQEAANKKPVVVLKVGTTNAGMKAASSHTGSLAGADMAYGAAFKRAGVMRVEDFESLFDASMVFSMQPLPQGNRVAIITNAGGPGIMAADAAEKEGLQVVPLENSTATALKQKLPAAASVGNPIDVLGDADPERYALALQAALKDPSVDSVLVILTPQAMTHPLETAKAMSACIDGSKPVVATFMGGKEVLPARDELLQAKLPDYPSPERAVKALGILCEYAQWKKRPPRVVNRFPVNRRRVERILTRAQKSGLKQMGEVEAKEILRAYNFNVPPGQLAINATEALEIAEKVGFPVAMKIVSQDIIHKTDFGGVKLGLNNTEEVRDAYDLMMLRTKRRLPDANITGVYVERMCPKGREVIIGMTRDPQFGPLLMFGLGGIFVEVMKDVTFYLAPITAKEAMEMLKATRSYQLLTGVRGQAGVDLDAIATALQKISQLVTDFPIITELDINPFFVGEEGKESFVADARMTLDLS
jgi:acetate---CoA ligase (ADP-forming)